MMISLFDGEQILNAYTKEKLDEGRAEGRAEGEIKGDKKRAIADATNMLKEGLPVEMIARIIRMPLAEVNALKAQLAQ